MALFLLDYLHNNFTILLEGVIICTAHAEHGSKLLITRSASNPSIFSFSSVILCPSILFSTGPPLILKFLSVGVII
ncbi:hypothetical protein [Saccharolobus islandicus]|nr:hypothetical protein [Sulfolobus islandicus]